MSKSKSVVSETPRALKIIRDLKPGESISRSNANVVFSYLVKKGVIDFTPVSTPQGLNWVPREICNKNGTSETPSKNSKSNEVPKPAIPQITAQSWPLTTQQYEENAKERSNLEIAQLRLNNERMEQENNQRKTHSLNDALSQKIEHARRNVEMLSKLCMYIFEKGLAGYDKDHDSLGYSEIHKLAMGIMKENVAVLSEAKNFKF